MTSVDASKPRVSLDGTCKLVPVGNQFLWLRLLEDKKWANGYQQSMVDSWQMQSALVSTTRGGTKARKGAAASVVSAPTTDAGVASLNDIVVKKWGCTRTHQVLTRIFLSAAKYEMKAASLFSTSKEEGDYRNTKAERSVLLEQMCCKKLEEAGSNQLRDWLSRIWVLFVSGVDNDPSGQRALSYDVRKNVHDAQFTNEDAIDLQASLLFFLLPSIKYETCHALAEADFLATPIVKPAELTGFESSQRRSTPPQQQFTRVFVGFVGCFLDTLTEVEVVKAATLLKPAVLDAQQRILTRPKAVAGVRKKSEDASISKGDGIRIDHLDKLGRRRLIQKFA